MAEPKTETGPEPGPLALYVHWPFCLSKCPYCDFNSHVRESVDEPGWREALLGELRHFAAETSGRRLGSIFFGGGTPSLMSAATVAAVIDAATDHWAVEPGIEITLEANPTSAEAGRFAGYRGAGVNRFSLGVQALDDAALAALGRHHSAREAIEAVTMAQRHAGRVSFDLIYARPGQDEASWRDELGRAIALCGDHLSLYQLSFEDGTPFGARARRGELAPPAEELAAALFEATQEMMAAAGLPAYEISNHARPGGECRHNLAYWRGDDYIGVGPGAHGRLTRDGMTEATVTERSPEAWIAAVRQRGHGVREREAIPLRERIDELVMMGLRTAEGISRRRFLVRTGRTIEQAVDGAALSLLISGGFLESDANSLRATAAGRQRLNAVLARLLAGGHAHDAGRNSADGMAGKAGRGG